MKKYIRIYIHVQGKCEVYAGVVFFMTLDLIPFLSIVRCNVVCKILIYYLRGEVVRVIIFSQELQSVVVVFIFILFLVWGFFYFFLVFYFV